jgi:DNA-binding PadR family transcriptional regulator
MSELTKTEEILLIAIWRLKEEAYGVRIRQHVSNLIGKDFTYGNLYSALNQLVKKKYVLKDPCGSMPQKRGRRRIIYCVSPQGIRELKAAMEMNEKLWTGISKMAFE